MVAIAIVGLAAIGWGYCAGRESVTIPPQAAKERTIRDTIRVWDTIIRRDTLRLRVVQAQSVQRLDAATVVRPDTLVPVVPRDTVDAVLASERAACDSALKSLTEQVRWLRKLDTVQTVRLESMDRRRWRDRIGVSVGYGMQVQRDGTVTTGPQIGLSVRVWP